jgi:hypothetical protein
MLYLNVSSSEEDCMINTPVKLLVIFVADTDTWEEVPLYEAIVRAKPGILRPRSGQVWRLRPFAEFILRHRGAQGDRVSGF